MKRSFEQVLLHLVVVSTVFLLGCGKHTDDANPADQLCRGASGFAAAIVGGAKSVEMCVSDQATIAQYIQDPAGDKYHITATFTSDSLTIDVQMSFFIQHVTPVTLTLTANEAEANADPSAAWFYYRESKLNTYQHAATVVNGLLTVTYNDAAIAVATFRGVELDLSDVSSGDPAGTRTISEGYVSVTAE